MQSGHTRVTRPFSKRAKLAIFATLTSVALAGCGDTAIEQALLGAGAGVGLATVAGTNGTNGALIGAAANVAYCQKYPTRC